MAATLESMDIAKRLRIPMRVAAKAFPQIVVRIAEEEEEKKKEKAIIENSSNNTGNNSNNETTTKQPSSSDDPAALNLQGWLDDACGMVDDSKMPLPENPGETKDASTDIPNAEQPPASSKQSGNGNDDGQSSNATSVEKDGDDNLDNWLDSMIE